MWLVLFEFWLNRLNSDQNSSQILIIIIWWLKHFMTNLVLYTHQKCQRKMNEIMPIMIQISTKCTFIAILALISQWNFIRMARINLKCGITWTQFYNLPPLNDNKCREKWAHFKRKIKLILQCPIFIANIRTSMAASVGI